MKTPRAHVLLLSLFVFSGILLFGVPEAIRAQQGPEEGGHELEIWSGGGYGVKGVAQHTGVWETGVRYGWILTSPHGPGFLRGRFEYAVDLVPLFLVFQPGSTAHGVALNPLGLKWDFDTHRRIVPYAELSGGSLFTNNQVPTGTSRINFASSGGIGLHFLTGKVTWSTDVRFMHISNSGISALNPGINTVQLRLGVGWFTRGR